MYNTDFNEKIFVLNQLIQRISLLDEWNPPIQHLKISHLEARMAYFKEIEKQYHVYYQQLSAIKETFRSKMKIAIEILPQYRASIRLYIRPRSDRHRQLTEIISRFRSKRKNSEQSTASTQRRRSSAMLSKTDKIDHLLALHAFMTTLPNYQPLADILSIEALEARIKELQELIQQNNLASLTLTHHRRERDAAEQEIMQLCTLLRDSLKSLKIK